MPQCPHCQAPYEAGQRYCSICGSFLLHPEQGDTFCPQCDVRVSPLQEFCHECDAPLKGAPAASEALDTTLGTAAPAPETAPAKIPPSRFSSKSASHLSRACRIARPILACIIRFLPVSPPLTAFDRRGRAISTPPDPPKFKSGPKPLLCPDFPVPKAHFQTDIVPPGPFFHNPPTTVIPTSIPPMARKAAQRFLPVIPTEARRRRAQWRDLLSHASGLFY